MARRRETGLDFTGFIKNIIQRGERGLGGIGRILFSPVVIALTLLSALILAMFFTGIADSVVKSTLGPKLEQINSGNLPTIAGSQYVKLNVTQKTYPYMLLQLVNESNVWKVYVKDPFEGTTLGIYNDITNYITAILVAILLITAVTGIKFDEKVMKILGGVALLVLATQILQYVILMLAGIGMATAMSLDALIAQINQVNLIVNLVGTVFNIVKGVALAIIIYQLVRIFFGKKALAVKRE